MAVPRGQRFEVPFDEVFPQGLYLVGEIAPVTEYQSQEDKARNRPVRPRTDEATGLPLFRGTFADRLRRRGMPILRDQRRDPADQRYRPHAGVGLRSLQHRMGDLGDQTGLARSCAAERPPSAEKDRDKSVAVEFASRVQPVPPAAIPGVPFRPVVLEGLTVQPRAEASGQAKWITWVVRANGMQPVGTAATSTPAGAGRSGNASTQGEQKAA
jgi:hypothetical protein